MEKSSSDLVARRGKNEWYKIGIQNVPPWRWNQDIFRSSNKDKKNFNSVKMVFLSKIISSQIFKIPSKKKYVYFQMYRGNASQ